VIFLLAALSTNESAAIAFPEEEPGNKAKLVMDYRPSV
jgi:hypothetical protein